MSGANGDKARFHRQRKQKIALRQRNRELVKRAATRRDSSDAASRAKPRSVLA